MTKEVIVDSKGVMTSGAGAMLIYDMLDQLAYEMGYEKGAQDLIGEEPAVNVEMMQIVFERLERARKLKELETKAREDAIRAKIKAELLEEMRNDPAYM
jgi:hypothetical protein